MILCLGSQPGRKIILCALESKDFGMATEAFNEMSEAARNEPFTRFLMFKIAIRTSDKDLGMWRFRIYCT